MPGLLGDLTPELTRSQSLGTEEILLIGRLRPELAKLQLD